MKCCVLTTATLPLCCLRSSNIKKKLLADDCTFDNALKVALGVEAADKDVADISQKGSHSVNKRLFSGASGRKAISKLDMTNAYQQLLLDDESQQYVTIKTHRGLYRYKRLPFGVAVSPAIFQRSVDVILQGIDNVSAIQDDILVTGKDEVDHLRNLEETHPRLQEYGVCLKLEKYNPELPLILECDASPYGVGAVICHRFPENIERPVAYASRSLNPVEKNYSQIEKERLAIVFGLSKLYMYLYARKFTLYTDHKPLLKIFAPDSATPVLAAARLQRRSLLLSSYQYEIRHKSSADIANVDALSRLPLKYRADASVEERIFSISD
ncbi:Hypothetical predicted protein [Paramuricea clavata]|uniref:Uncharacterized protein n=1 Tax=Paramuricea clavata TaxID=317549 RepID=A0A6S7HKB7_PARCT|nr:Hypothetical predicted protein [Paramuricea clavata]